MVEHLLKTARHTQVVEMSTFRHVRGFPLEFSNYKTDATVWIPAGCVAHTLINSQLNVKRRCVNVLYYYHSSHIVILIHHRGFSDSFPRKKKLT